LERETRLQLCGRVVIRVDGRAIDLPGRQGRLLFVYLALNRLRLVRRAELLDAVWPESRPSGSESALSALLSKLRRQLGPGQLPPRGEVRLVLPPAAFVDFEAALETIHRAEAARRLGDWTGVWGPARVALHTAQRGFLAGEDAPWITERRHQLEEIEVRAHECIAESGLELGATELDSVKRSGHALIGLTPYRDSGYRFLMEALSREGNSAEALSVYDRLRLLLRYELGAAPSAETQKLHRHLLGAS
jgi:DNA-binding SARP family transcriptional activator